MSFDWEPDIHLLQYLHARYLDYTEKFLEVLQQGTALHPASEVAGYTALPPNSLGPDEAAQLLAQVQQQLQALQQVGESLEQLRTLSEPRPRPERH